MKRGPQRRLTKVQLLAIEKKASQRNVRCFEESSQMIDALLAHLRWLQAYEKADGCGYTCKKCGWFIEEEVMGDVVNKHHAPTCKLYDPRKK
jgi:hypothetical protein